MNRSEVNRRNAQRSTGPRTVEGKAVVSRNAVRHGLFSRELLLVTEKPEELTEFANRMYADLQPVGALEELVFEKLVAAAWRLKRLLLMEKGVFEGVIKSALDSIGHHGNNGSEIRVRIVSADDPDPSDNRTTPTREPISPGFQLLSEGVLSFCDLTAIAHEAEQRGLDEEKVFAHMLAQRYDSRDNGTQGKEPLQLLARYEATLERSFYKALHELQRLQFRRTGQGAAIPPAFDFDLG